MQKDFDYISELIHEFFSKAYIIERFKIIHENDITGWEVWFQIEFSNFLALHKSEPEWGREIKLEFDRRSEKIRSYFRPDFIIRKKGWKIDTYAVLEVKQDKSIVSCIKKMQVDIEKVSKMRSSEIAMRSFWSLGIFKADPKCNIKKIVESSFPESTPAQIKSDVIKDTIFAYLLI